MRVQTWDKKIYDVPEENLEGFLSDYNKATNFDPAKLSSDPNINPERGANWAGTLRAAAQGIPAIGSYADEAEAWVRSKIGDKSYDDYLKNARESTEGAFINTPERAYAANIGAGLLGETIYALLSHGATLTPQAQAAMNAVYGYGAGEGDWKNRAENAAIYGALGAALPVAGRYVAKGGKAAIKGIKEGVENYATRKIPNTIKALNTMADPETGLNVVASYTNSAGQKDINILSSLMHSVDDYPTQSKIATELVKETPKSAALYESGIMGSADDLARIGWKNQITGAIDDIASGITNQKDKEILTKISDKLSKATRNTIESADNSLEEVELKDVREIVNYAIDKFGKGLSDDTKKILEKRMIAEGMAKRVSNKLVNKSLAESAKRSTPIELAKDAAIGLAADAALPGTGLLFALGRNAVFGGGGTTVINKGVNKVVDKVLEKSLQKAELNTNKKEVIKDVLTNHSVKIKDTTPKQQATLRRLGEGLKKPKKLKNMVRQKTDLQEALESPSTYINPITRSLIPVLQ